MIWYVTCLESVMKELVISHWRGAALCLRFCRRLSLFLFVSPGFVWCRPNGGEEWDRKRRMTSPRCTQRCLFLAPRGENTILKPVYCPWLPEWWFFSLTWTLLNGCSHISGPHNDSYHFTSNSMFKDRKKTLPLALLCQHFVVVRAIQGLRLFLYSAYISVIQLKKTFPLPGETILLLTYNLRAFLFLAGALVTCFTSLLCHHHDCNLCPSLLPQRFVGNTNSEAVVQNKLSHPVRTRFLRFVPRDWNPSGWMGLRVEVYGCSYSE